MFLLAGLVAGGLAVIRAVTTLNGVPLAGILVVASAATGFIIYLALIKHFGKVLHQIVGGKKRIAILATEVSVALAGIAIFGALQLNRTFASKPLVTVQATVEKVNRVNGPKLWGWDATFKIADKTYYQMISPEVADAAMNSREVILTLQPGALGYSYIIGASAQ